MTLKMTTRYCLRCDRETLHLRDGVDHVLHLLFAVLTGGLWAIGWLITAAMTNRVELCVHCSTPVGASRMRQQRPPERVVVEVDPID